MDRLTRYIPVLAWLPRYDSRWLAGDAIAGLTVWALVVPESMAYAAIAGVPVQYGLYSVPLALLGYVIFGSSRQLFVGPSATVATLSAVSVGSVVAAQANPHAYIALTAAMALVVGMVYVILGIARMGFVARFFATSVLDGFIIGLGLYIAIGQFPKLVGIKKPSGDTVQIFLSTLGHIGSWQWWTVSVGVLGLALLFGMARFAPKLPGALIVVVLGIAATKLLDLSSHGVSLVGEVPTGFTFVPWSSITWSQVSDIVPGALAIVVVGFAQSVAVAEAYAAKNHYSVDASQEMIGYGASNIGAGVLQGFTVTGSLSKSAAAEQAGGKSPILLLVVSLAVVLTVLFLAGIFRDLPEAILAAIVIHAVSGMIDFSKLSRLWRVYRAEFWIALAALLGVIVINVLPGVVIGVALSFALLIHNLDHPRVAILGRSRDGSVYENLATHHDATPVPGVIIYRFEAPLIFVNSEVFIRGIRERLATEKRISKLVLDFEAVSEVDVTGIDALRELNDELRGEHVELAIARASLPVIAFMRRDGLASTIGEDHLYRTVRDAVESRVLQPIQ